MGFAHPAVVWENQSLTKFKNREVNKMRYGNFDEKSKEYYIEAFKTEVSHNLEFYKTDIRNHKKNKAKLEDQTEEENRAICACEVEIAAIEAKLGDLDGQAKRLLFRDFRSVINNILNGEEGQQSARFGLKIQKQGPYLIEKPVSISSEGKRHTEVRTVSVMKFKNNEAALEKFRTYLREGYNLPIDTLTFDQLKAAIEKFFADAPKVDIYGDEYETETFVNSEKVIKADQLFRI
jgi:hypothetical protein